MPATAQGLTLYPRRSAAVWLLLVCSVFVALGIWMGLRGDWRGFLCAGFFGLGLPVGAVQLIPGSSYLELDTAGFTFCTLFRRTTVAWADVAGFYVVTLRQSGLKVRELVGFNFAASYDKARLGRKIASLIGQCEGALPDTYGQPAGELAALMNACLARVRAHAQPAGGSGSAPP